MASDMSEKRPGRAGGRTPAESDRESSQDGKVVDDGVQAAGRANPARAPRRGGFPGPFGLRPLREPQQGQTPEQRKGGAPGLHDLRRAETVQPQIANNETSIDDQQKAVEELKTRLEREKEERRQLQGQLRVRFEAAQARIAEKEELIAAQDKVIDELRSRIDREAEERRQGHSQLRVRFDAAWARISDKDGLIAAQGKAIEQLTSRLDNESEQRRNVQAQLATMRRQVEAHLTAIQAQLAAMSPHRQESTSSRRRWWQWTRRQ